MTSLTSRQEQVARLVADGLLDKHIGRELNMSARAVRYDISEIAEAWNLDRTRNLRTQIARRLSRVAA